LVVVNDSSSQPTALGSGFFVRPGVIATNLHVIEGAAGGYIKLVGSSAKVPIAGTVGVDAEHDLALLSVSNSAAPALPLGDREQISVGDGIFVVGNPRGLEGTFSEGIISAIRRSESGTLLQITAPISPGSSGGPVLENRGQVIGIAKGAISGGQNLNFAIPVSYLAGLLHHTGSVVPLSSNSQQTDKTSLLGSRSTDGVLGSDLQFEPPFVPGTHIRAPDSIASEGDF
jgi:S1-C subfamily serine protease